MNTLKEILEQNENVYIWDDEKYTLDVCLHNVDVPFIKQLIKFNCLKCGKSIINKNEHIVKAIDDNVKGISLQCHACNQSHFIHMFVKINQ